MTAYEVITPDSNNNTLVIFSEYEEESFQPVKVLTLDAGTSVRKIPAGAANNNNGGGGGGGFMIGRSAAGFSVALTAASTGNRPGGGSGGNGAFGDHNGGSGGGGRSLGGGSGGRGGFGTGAHSSSSDYNNSPFLDFYTGSDYQ